LSTKHKNCGYNSQKTEHIGSFVFSSEGM